MTWSWLMLVVLAFMLGASIVAGFILPTMLEFAAVTVGIATFAGIAYSMISIATLYTRVDAVFYAFAFLAAGGFGGWAFSSALLERWSPEDKAVRLGPQPELRTGTALVVFGCVDPPKYAVRDTASMLAELRDDGLYEPTFGTIPLVFFAQKSRYRAIGGVAPGPRQLSVLANHLRDSLDPVAFSECTFATCSGKDRLAQRVADLAASGIERIVILPAAIEESLDMAQAQREVDSLRVHELGVELVRAVPLRGSEALLTMQVSRITASASEDSRTGVVLLGHGQPDSRSRLNPAFDEAETAALTRLKMRLIDAGLEDSKIQIAWAEWGEPDVSEALRHLAAHECKRILVAPATYPFDSLTTLLDVPMSIQQARLAEDVSVIVLPTWQDDAVVQGEFVSRVLEAEVDAS